MSTTTNPPIDAPSPTPPPLAREGSVLAGTLRSEWTKLRSVPSTVWSLLATVAITIGLGALLSWAYENRYDRIPARQRLTFDPTVHSLSGIFLAQLAIGVLGVLVISSEHSTGLIRATLTAIPQRRIVLAAKAVMFGVVAIVTSAISVVAAFLIGQAILGQRHLGVSVTTPGVTRALFGATAYLVFIGLLGLGLGTILRRTAGAIAALFGLVLILPALALALPSPWDTDVSQVLPGPAGQALFTVRPNADLLSPGIAALVCLAWLVGVFVVATVLFARRDA